MRARNHRVSMYHHRSADLQKWGLTRALQAIHEVDGIGEDDRTREKGVVLKFTPAHFGFCGD